MLPAVIMPAVVPSQYLVGFLVPSHVDLQSALACLVLRVDRATARPKEQKRHSKKCAQIITLLGSMVEQYNILRPFGSVPRPEAKLEDIKQHIFPWAVEYRAPHDEDASGGAVGPRCACYGASSYVRHSGVHVSAVQLICWTFNARNMLAMTACLLTLFVVNRLQLAGCYKCTA